MTPFGVGELIFELFENLKTKIITVGLVSGKPVLDQEVVIPYTCARQLNVVFLFWWENFTEMNLGLRPLKQRISRIKTIVWKTGAEVCW